MQWHRTDLAATRQFWRPRGDHRQTVPLATRWSGPDNPAAMRWLQDTYVTLVFIFWFLILVFRQITKHIFKKIINKNLFVFWKVFLKAKNEKYFLWGLHPKTFLDNDFWSVFCFEEERPIFENGCQMVCKCFACEREQLRS